MRAIAQYCDKPYGELIEIGNDLRSLQNFVGGRVEAFTTEWRGKTAVVLCDEEGRLKRKKPNCTLYGENLRACVDFAGDILVVGVDGEDFADCPVTLDDWKKMIGRWTP